MNIADNVMGIQHLGLPTKDLKKTVAFYESLGFTDIWHNDMATFLKLGNLVIETYPADTVAGKSGAIDHVALDVKDVYAAYEFCRNNGYDIIPSTSSTGVDSLPFFANGVSFFTITGPNGEKVEFNQIL